jgi:NADPH2:quinone reductase
MKAIRVHEFGRPEVLKLEEVADPSPAPGQVLVRISAAGVNPVDGYIRTGTHARKPPLPYTPGSDGAGTIERVGNATGPFRAGDRVYVTRAADPSAGTYAELVVCNENDAYPLPRQLSFAQGAAVGVPYGTAYRALFDRAQSQPGETVLVHGATGGVGIASVQLALAHKMIVIGTGGTERGRGLVAEQGVQHVLDHRSPGYLDEVKRITSGKGVNTIIEMLANVNLGNDLPLLAFGGRVVVVGSRGAVQINPRDLMGREASILGMSLWSAGDELVSHAHAAIVKGLNDGSLRPVVGRELPLADAARAHEAIMTETAYGKIVLVP